MTRRCLALTLFLVPLFARAADSEDAIRSAIEKGLRRVEKGGANYMKNRQCFSCHHQATTMSVLTAAGKRGFKVEPEAVPQQIAYTIDYWKPRHEKLHKGEGSGGGNSMVAYSLWALAVSGHKPDDTTNALIEYLLQKQKADGAWAPVTTRRPPTEGSTFTNNALAIHALKAYLPAKEDKEKAKLRDRIEGALKKGGEWIIKNKPAHMEDESSRLRGLAYSGAPNEEIEKARKALVEKQTAEGSWSQTADMKPDAYATATAMLALRASGMGAKDDAYQKGVKYLLKEQKDDGLWFVETRSFPVQTFFDNGDPGGKSQFISFAATSWATLALLETYPEKKP